MPGPYGCVRPAAMAPGDYPRRRWYQRRGTVGYGACVIRVYLGHGASDTAASMKPWVDGLADRGIEAYALDLPKRKAEDAVAAYGAGAQRAGRRRRRPLVRRPGRVARGGRRGLAGATPLPARTRGSSACPTRSTRPAVPRTPAARIAHWPGSASRPC